MAAIFIDETDFAATTLYSIPNQQESQHFAQFLETTEREILERLLCVDLCNELFDAFEASGDPDQKWLDFRDGVDGFEWGGEKYNWNGLVDLLQPAIYAEWCRFNYDKLTNIGIGINQKTDFNMVEPNQRIVNNHNQFVRRAFVLHQWLEFSQADFELWEGFCTTPEMQNSLGI